MKELFYGVSLTLSSFQDICLMGLNSKIGIKRCRMFYHSVGNEAETFTTHIHMLSTSYVMQNYVTNSVQEAVRESNMYFWTEAFKWLSWDPLPLIYYSKLCSHVLRSWSFQLGFFPA